MPDLVAPEIDAYRETHTTQLPLLLEELVRETKAQLADRSQMLSGQVEGMFLQMLVAAKVRSGCWRWGHSPGSAH